MKKLLILLIITLFVQSCTKIIGDSGEFSESFIRIFRIIEGARVTVKGNQDNIPVSISVIGYEWVQDSKQTNILLQKYNDTEYNGYISMSGMDDHWVFSDSFLAIDLVSDKQFDDAHPAGKSLSDIVIFIGWTPYPYIKNGYKRPEGQSSDILVIKKKLNQLTVEDLYLINSHFEISFENNQSIVKGLHKMKLILTKEDGTKAELPFEIDFK